MPSGIDKTVAGFIASLIREMRGPDEGVSFDKLAVDLGVSKPQLVNIVGSGKGAGPKVEQAFADKRFGGSVDKLRAAARVWADKQPRAEAPRDVVVELDPRYHALGALLKDKRFAGRWSKPAIAAAESMALDSDADLEEAAWVQMLDRLDAAIAVSVPKLPARGAAAIAELDEPRVRPARKKR